MFNIKNIVNKITDRGRESQPNSPGRGNGEDILNKQAAEGFLCPKCMQAFPSPEELESHYGSSHNGDGEGAIPDIPAVSNALDFLSLHQEVGERYKHQEGNYTQDTSIIDVQAITDPIELKRRLMEALENGMLLQQEKERLEQRAAQLARDNVTLKAASDEGEGNQAAMKERLKVVEAQLAHRESIDDAAVLRQELVQVQRVMDELTRERERERDQLKAELKQLKDQYVAREVTDISNEQAYNAEAQRRQEDLEITLRSRESCITALQNDIGIYKKKLNEAETKLHQELSRSQTLEQEVQVLKDRVGEVSEECEKKTDDILHWQNEYAEMKRERDQVQKLQQNGANEINILLQQAEEIKAKYDAALKEREEKEEGIKSAQSRLDALYKQKDILKSELTHKSKVCEELEKSNSSLHEKIKEAEREVLHKKEEIARLESERAELLVQIEAGEGASTAIQQLSQEKMLLNKELKEQMQYHATYAKDMSTKLEGATAQVHDLEESNKGMVLQLGNHENKIHSLSTELQELQKEVVRLTDDLNKKENALQVLRSSSDHLKSEKDVCDQKIHDLECLLQEKSSSITRCSEKIDNMNDILQTYERRLDELEVENKSLEDKLREQESKIDQLNINLVATELKLKESVSQVADLCAEVEVKTVYGSQLREENAKLAVEFSSLKENLKEKEEQLQVLGVQKASLETSLFELTAEVEEDKKKIEDKWKKDVEKIRSKLEHSQVMISELEEGKKVLLDERSEMMQQIATLERNLEEASKTAHEKHSALQNQLSAVTAAKQTTEEELAAERCKCLELKNDKESVKEAYEVEIEKKNQELKDVHTCLDDVAGEKLGKEM
ncbi:hypothetical protein B7P43_G03675 [Cryptotermes secundus]|uniref:C2H2-type domain-containing protein n=1 Tax=Cryptotermes secundus TaxID=105785 RepID=A0A2J7RNE6_9NEOP|nr:hypothetical protein B7P43_G03675 [Cryptotermes secundus]